MANITNLHRALQIKPLYTNNKKSLTNIINVLLNEYVPPVIPEPVNNKIWIPGHYVRLYDNTTTHWTNANRVLDYADAGGNFFKGYGYNFHWYYLETAENVYNWNLLETMLDKAASYGRKMIAQLFERSYNYTSSVIPPSIPAVPAYLQRDDLYGGQVLGTDTVNGWTRYHARLDLPEVAERYAALIIAAGKAFEGHPALSLLMSDETAMPGLDTAPGYNAVTYLNNRKNIATSIHNADLKFPYVCLSNYAVGWTNTQAIEWIEYHTSQGHGFGAPNPAADGPTTVVWKEDTPPFGYAYSVKSGLVPIIINFEGVWDLWDNPKTPLEHMYLNQHHTFTIWHIVETLGVKDAKFTIYDAIDYINSPGATSYVSNRPSLVL